MNPRNKRVLCKVKCHCWFGLYMLLSYLVVYSSVFILCFERMLLCFYFTVDSWELKREFVYAAHLFLDFVWMLSIDVGR